jgi:DNA mismatch endonuclease (patch repair protein)
MSRIRGKDTKPEILVRKTLFSNGFRYRLHVKKLPGKPDIVLPKLKTVIFVHGCYWHGHENCRYFALPKTRTDWWRNKINGNKLRDEENRKILIRNGWKIITVFECELKKEKRKNTLSAIIRKLNRLTKKLT